MASSSAFLAVDNSVIFADFSIAMLKVDSILAIAASAPPDFAGGTALILVLLAGFNGFVGCNDFYTPQAANYTKQSTSELPSCRHSFAHLNSKQVLKKNP